MSRTRPARKLYLTPVESLIGAKEQVNPALRMSWVLQQRALREDLRIEELIPLAGEIDEALKESGNLVSETITIRTRLMSAEGTPAQIVPLGF